MAWSAASIFAIPIMIREENSNPVQLLKKSSTTLKKKWGETVAGYVGVSAAFAMIFVGLILGAVVLGNALPEPHQRALLVKAGIAGLLLASVFVAAIELIFKCALYIYATEDVIPTPYDAEQMDMVWKIKKQ
jgi:cytochrome c biogenesis protein CcdA